MTSYAKRPRDFAYLAWVACQQCIVCEAQHKPQFSRSYAHHAGARGLSQRAADRTAIPLCWKHHDRGSSLSIHTLGKKFWTVYGLNRNAVIAELQARYDLEHGRLAA
jgi:hypothetical protein